MKKWIVQTIKNEDDCMSVEADCMRILPGDSSKNIPCTVKFGESITFNMNHIVYIKEDRD